MKGIGFTRWGGGRGVRVRVARNLHKKLYSIRYKGKVVGYRKRILLTNVKFLVSEKGRQRVLQEGKKNVHAFAEGDWVRRGGAFGTDANGKKEFPIKVKYNPYEDTSFVTSDGSKVECAWGVLLNERGVSACYLGLGCEK